MRKKLIEVTILSIFAITLCACQKGEIGVSNNTSTTKEVVKESVLETTTIQETTTEESTTEYIELSADCDYILCDGYDGDDYYELVANEKEDYPESTFEFGVIRNNEWLVEMNTKNPFLDEDGWWKGVDKDFSNTIDEESFIYLDEGCFMYKNSIVYKPSTNVYFEVCNTEQVYMDDLDGEIDYEEIVNDGKMVTFNKDIKLAVFNMNTGKTKEIGGYIKQKADDEADRADELHGISEGIFFAECSSNFTGMHYSGFFNTDGEMIIDLTEYDITDYGDYMFEDGEITLTCLNKSNVEFYLTFNKKGKIIHKEKVG